MISLPAAPPTTQIEVASPDDVARAWQAWLVDGKEGCYLGESRPVWMGANFWHVTWVKVIDRKIKSKHARIKGPRNYDKVLPLDQPVNLRPKDTMKLTLQIILHQ